MNNSPDGGDGRYMDLSSGPRPRTVNSLAGSNIKQRNPLEEFWQHMMNPIDLNDPAVKQLIAGAGNAAGTAAANRGIQGPMSVNGIQNNVVNALNGSQMDRYRMGLDAYGRMQQDNQLAEQRYQFDTGQYNAARQRETDQAAGGAGMVGGVVGGAVGLGATLLTAGAAAPLIPGLISAGTNAGKWVGAQGSGYGGSSGAAPTRGYGVY